MTFTTANLCDTHSEQDNLQIAEPLLKSYGGKLSFNGQISTVKAFEDNVLIRTVLEQKVESRVLVVDGGGSHRCALVGEELARLAIANGWQGIVIHGCIRDSESINQLPIGIRALHTHPLKSHKKDPGDRELLVTFAGVNFKQNHFLYADADGIIVSETMLS
jgi:regulator of ribonuclease activity A